MRFPVTLPNHAGYAPDVAQPLTLVRALADLVRLAALASAVGAFFLFPIEGGVRFSLVFVALLVPRLAGRIPAPFDLAYCVTLLLAAWAAAAGWYRTAAWVDWPVHAVTTGAIAAMLYLLLARFGLLPDLLDRPLRGHPSSVVLLTVALGFAAGALWELYEWLGKALLQGTMLVGYDDTIADLFMDGVGSLVGGLGLVAWAASNRRGRVERRTKSLRSPAR